MLDCCEKCGGKLPYWEESVGAIRFMQCFSAKLCTACVNETTRQIHENPLWQEQIYLDASIAYWRAAAANNPAAEAELQRLIAKEDILTRHWGELLSRLVPQQTAKEREERKAERSPA